MDPPTSRLNFWRGLARFPPRETVNLQSLLSTDCVLAYSSFWRILAARAVGCVPGASGVKGSCGSDRSPFCVVAMVVEAALMGD
jgi:hypothetical protein